MAATAARLKRLRALSEQTRKAQAKAETSRAERDALALALQREGVTYPVLAETIGSPDDPSKPLSLARVTQVLRRQREREAKRKS